MPLDRGALDAQLREIGAGERWWEHSEFRELPHLLGAEERIAALVSGILLGRRRPRLLPRASWLFVATDQRLILLRRMRFGRKQIDIVPGQIARIQQRSRSRAFHVTIDTPVRQYRIRIAPSDAFRFASALARLAPDAQVPDAAPALQAAPRLGGLLGGGSAPEPAPRETVQRLERALDDLRGDVERLQQQVAFLEDLLEKRGEETLLARR